MSGLEARPCTPAQPTDVALLPSVLPTAPITWNSAPERATDPLWRPPSVAEPPFAGLGHADDDGEMPDSSERIGAGLAEFLQKTGPSLRSCTRPCRSSIRHRPWPPTGIPTTRPRPRPRTCGVQTRRGRPLDVRSTSRYRCRTSTRVWNSSRSAVPTHSSASRSDQRPLIGSTRLASACLPTTRPGGGSGTTCLGGRKHQRRSQPL